MNVVRCKKCNKRFDSENYDALSYHLRCEDFLVSNIKNGEQEHTFSKKKLFKFYVFFGGMIVVLLGILLFTPNVNAQNYFYDVGAMTTLTQNNYALGIIIVPKTNITLINFTTGGGNANQCGVSLRLSPSVYLFNGTPSSGVCNVNINLTKDVQYFLFQYQTNSYTATRVVGGNTVTPVNVGSPIGFVINTTCYRLGWNGTIECPPPGGAGDWYGVKSIFAINSSSPPVPDNFSITAKDLVNENILNFCVEIYKGATFIEDSCTSTGTLRTSINSTDTNTYSLFPYNATGSKGAYIGSVSGNEFLVTPSTDHPFVMTGFYQANISFEPRTIVTNQSIPFNSSEVILYHVSGDTYLNVTEATRTANTYDVGLQLVPYAVPPTYMYSVGFSHKISTSSRTSDAFVRFTYNDSTTADSSVFSTDSTSYVTQTAINPNPGKPVTLIQLQHKISATTATSTVTNLTYERYSKLNRDNNLVLTSQNGTQAQKTFMVLPGYHNQSFNYSLAPLTTTTLTEYFYSSVLNVSVYNGFTNFLITNWTGNITHISSGWSTNINSSNNLVNLLFGDYTVYVESPGYAISDEDNFKNVTVSASTQNVNLSLYSNNSVRVFVRDEATNSLITELISIVISGSSGDSNYSTSNGTFFIDNLPDGAYNFKFSGENYTLRSYDITVADRSTQQLTAILSKSTSVVTFTVLDDLTSGLIEGASLGMYRLINNSWSLIESKLSDITGRAQFSYTPDIRYKFVVSKSGYTTKEFELNPVIFNSYNVRLQRKSQIPTDQQQMVSVDFTPKMFFDEIFTPFNIYFRTVNGTFLYYNYTLVLPDGTTYSDFGNESQGQGFVVNVNITGARYNDYVNLTYFYKTTLAGEYSRFVQIPVLNGTNTNTFIYNIRETYGLGIFERALIAMLIVAIVGGVATLIAGNLAGIGLGMLLTGYFAYIGFVPIWGALIVLFVGFLFLSRREM